MRIARVPPDTLARAGARGWNVGVAAYSRCRFAADPRFSIFLRFNFDEKTDGARPFASTVVKIETAKTEKERF
jgi:hypothetical protein